MVSFFREMYVHRELLSNFVVRDLASKYKETFMGFFWNVIGPLITLILYTFVFSVIFKVKFGDRDTTGNFAIYLFCGMVPWLAFHEAVGKCVGIIINHTNLVKKTVFPLEVLPCYAIISSAVTELFGVGILLLATAVMLKTINATAVGVPLLMIMQGVFALGLGMFFAAMTVFFRDVMHFVPVMMTTWMFLTPIMYPETMIPERFRFLLWLNPMALHVGMFRDVVLEGTVPPITDFLAFSGYAIASFVVGLYFFRKTKWEFADVI